MTCACGKPATVRGPHREPLCVACEYARIRALPPTQLWNPAKGMDVAEQWFKLHGGAGAGA